MQGTINCCSSTTLKGKLNEGTREIPITGGFDYNNAINKPSINDVELGSGNHTLDELGIQEKGNYVDKTSYDEKVKELSEKDTSLEKSIEETNTNLETNYTDNDTLAQTYAKKSDISNVYKYKGTVATFSELKEKESQAVNGDVWETTDDGRNYAWNGTTWDDLGGNVVFNFLEQDNTNVWDLNGNYVLKSDLNVYIQTGSSIPLQAGSEINVTSKNDKIHYYITDTNGKLYYGIVGTDGTPEENGNAIIDLNKILTNDNTNEYEVNGNYVPAHKEYVDKSIENGTQDLFQGLERQLNEENKAKTTVNIKNKIGGTELIMEIDDLDQQSEIPTNRVLGAIKGEDFEKRIKELEENSGGSDVKYFILNKAQQVEDNEKLSEIVECINNSTPFVVFLYDNLENKWLIFENYKKNNDYLYIAFSEINFSSSTGNDFMKYKKNIEHVISYDINKNTHSIAQYYGYAIADSEKLLKIDNTTEFTPTDNYNPATKLYVDNSIATAITGALEADY